MFALVTTLLAAHVGGNQLGIDGNGARAVSEIHLRPTDVQSSEGVRAHPRRHPSFSWHTVPVFAETSNISGVFDADAISTLARFPLFVAEKVSDISVALQLQVQQLSPSLHQKNVKDSVSL